MKNYNILTKSRQNCKIIFFTKIVIIYIVLKVKYLNIYYIELIIYTKNYNYIMNFYN